MSGGLTATGLVVLLLALIGAGVGLYYAYICLQARPLRPKKPKDAEHGPLIPPDPDVNGNHEDVPLDPSAPLHDEADADLKPDPDQPDESASPPDPPRADSPEPPKAKEDVLISVEDDVPPAKIIHEKETAPVVNCTPPVGFVVPPSAAAPQETPMDHHPAPKDLQPQPEKVESPPSTSSAPVPVYIPSPPQKKPIAISDEEDGLLLHEPAPHDDDSLTPDLCATLPVSHPRKPCLREEPEIISQPSPKPEGQPPAIPPRQPAAVPKVDSTPELEAQPVVVVAPQTAPSCPEKEELKPVGKAADTLPSESCGEPAPVCMKDNEHIPSAAIGEDVNKKTPEPSSDEVPVTKAVPPEPLNVEPGDPVHKEAAVESDDSLSTGDCNEGMEPTPKFVENNEAPKNLPENDKIEPTPDKMDTHEETRSVSSCSVSSEDPVPPSDTPTSAEVKPEPSVEAAAPLESSHLQPRKSEEVVEGDIPASPAAVPEPDTDISPANTVEDTSSTPQAEPPSSAPLQSSADEAEDVSDASSDVSDTNNEDQNTPTEMPVTPSEIEIDSDKETPATLSQPTVDIPIDASNVPLEAYNVIPDDTSDEEVSTLPVIKEESVENNSEGSTDTDSSEPEVTEYSFSSGPSAPSTASVLANEVSCTMEPKVTKFCPITDLDATDSEGSEISDDDLEEDDSASLSKASDDDNTDPVPENKIVAEKKPANTTGDSNAVPDHSDTSEEDPVTDLKPIASSNGPVASETPDPASKLPENEVSDSGDSDTESEGAEAEVELKEELVSIPAVVCENTNYHNAVPKESPTLPSAKHAGKPSETCPQLPKASQGNSNSLEELPSATDEDDDGLSLSPSESCDLSDGELTTSTPKKSMIPRLVKQSEA